MVPKRCLVIFWFVVSLYFLRKRMKRGAVFKSDKRLVGKTVLITGGNAGIGKAIAISFAKRGARVVIASRNVKKSEAARQEIMEISSNKNVVVMKLDLEDFESISRFAQYFNQNEANIHFLINNAGVLGINGTTKQGYNRVFAINHFGPFLLTQLLLPKMKKQAETAEVRIVNLSSMLYRLYTLDFDTIRQDESNVLFHLKIYCQSKLANIYFNRELHKRLAGCNITTFALHPGVIKSDMGCDSLFAHFPFNILYDMTAFMALREPEYGAQTVMYCALDENVTQRSGEYFNACRREELWEIGMDDEASENLWAESVAVTKEYLHSSKTL